MVKANQAALRTDRVMLFVVYVTGVIAASLLVYVFFRCPASGDAFSMRGSKAGSHA